MSSRYTLLMQRQCLHLLDRQPDQLRSASEATGINPSELVRRMIDYCLQPVILNELVPCLSGAIKVNQ